MLPKYYIFLFIYIFLYFFDDYYIYSIQFKIICIAPFTIQSLQSSFTEKYVSTIYLEYVCMYLYIYIYIYIYK